MIPTVIHKARGCFGYSSIERFFQRAREIYFYSVHTYDPTVGSSTFRELFLYIFPRRKSSFEFARGAVTGCEVLCSRVIEPGIMRETETRLLFAHHSAAHLCAAEGVILALARNPSDLFPRNSYPAPPRDPSRLVRPPQGGSKCRETRKPFPRATPNRSEIYRHLPRFNRDEASSVSLAQFSFLFFCFVFFTLLFPAIVRGLHVLRSCRLPAEFSRWKLFPPSAPTASLREPVRNQSTEAGGYFSVATISLPDSR